MLDALWKVLLVVVVIFFTKKISHSAARKIMFYFYFFVFYLTGSLLACVIWPYFLLNPKNVKNAKAAANILKYVTKLYDLKWELRNSEILAEERGAIIVSNHQSSLDVLGLFNIWNVVDKLTVIAKKEVFYVWPFGLAAYLAGVVFIDRKDTKGAYKQLRETSELMNRKTKIWLFPEGTRNKDYTKLLPFKKGAFSMAIAAQKPVIPVVFSPYYFINKSKYVFSKGHVVIQCLDPISTQGMTMDDVSRLTEKVHDVMEKAFINLSNEVFSSLPSDYPHTLKG
ncbi:1-acyl-sn-glycerol-3-phosphate acyltransferase alpha-like [Zerene cesonia]|uniref:1-acyl-sn-glycerol-3-phosphate acyltransferase alpha-like n=1 Tax=Zerene cesonia TaxID=33412 RepID=UPI0018E5687C|nr:1-acyl-sn-glycerol-3-phosphate acyltransferase alpha-like [Zerene cesonia]